MSVSIFEITKDVLKPQGLTGLGQDHGPELFISRHGCGAEAALSGGYKPGQATCQDESFDISLDRSWKTLLRCQDTVESFVESLRGLQSSFLC